MKNIPLSILLPILSMLFVIAVGGGLGVIFILISKTSLHQWGAVIIGTSLVFIVPLVAMIITAPKRG